jgi:UDP-N-acetylglucosamine 2-epimerase
MRQMKTGTVKRILFVPTNDRDCAMFARVVTKLEASNVPLSLRVISLENLNRGEGIAKALQGSGLPSSIIEDYGTYDVTKIVKREQPDLIIVTCDYSFVEQAFVLAGLHLSAPTLLIQNGARGNAPMTNYFKAGIRKLRRNPSLYIRRYRYMLRTLRSTGTSWPGTAIHAFKDLFEGLSGNPVLGSRGSQRIVVSSDYDRDFLLRKGIESQRVVVTGNPLYDDMSLAVGPSDATFADDEPVLQREKTTILLLTSATVEHGMWTEAMRDKYVREILGAVNQIGSEAELVIKIHPMESLETYSRLLPKESQIKISLCKEASILDLIQSSDVVITYYSTTTMAALALNKPVLIVNLFNEPEYLPYVTSGAAVGARRPEDILPALRDALYNPVVKNKLSQARKGFLEGYRYNLDGQATKRVAEAITHMLEEAKKPIAVPLSRGERRRRG